jgi:hypothetical protein
MANKTVFPAGHWSLQVDIPFRCLAYYGMVIEIEAIAMIDAD